jgi:hypothetical protein
MNLTSRLVKLHGEEKMLERLKALNIPDADKNLIPEMLKSAGKTVAVSRLVLLVKMGIHEYVKGKARVVSVMDKQYYGTMVIDAVLASRRKMVPEVQAIFSNW